MDDDNTRDDDSPISFVIDEVSSSSETSPATGICDESSDGWLIAKSDRNAFVAVSFQTPILINKILLINNGAAVFSVQAQLLNSPGYKDITKAKSARTWAESKARTNMNGLYELKGNDLLFHDLPVIKLKFLLSSAFDPKAIYGLKLVQVFGRPFDPSSLVKGNNNNNDNKGNNNSKGNNDSDRDTEEIPMLQRYKNKNTATDNDSQNPTPELMEKTLVITDLPEAVESTLIFHPGQLDMEAIEDNHHPSTSNQQKPSKIISAINNNSNSNSNSNSNNKQPAATVIMEAKAIPKPTIILKLPNQQQESTKNAPTGKKIAEREDNFNEEEEEEEEEQLPSSAPRVIPNWGAAGNDKGKKPASKAKAIQPPKKATVAPPPPPPPLPNKSQQQQPPSKNSKAPPLPPGPPSNNNNDDDIEIAVSKKRNDERSDLDTRNQASVNKTTIAAPTPFNKILAKVVMVLSGFVDPQRSQLRNKVKEMGGQYRPAWDKDATHLIATDVSNPKCADAKKTNGIIVTSKWIDDCYSKKKLLPVESYYLNPKRKNFSDDDDDDDDDESGSDIGRGARKNLRKRKKIHYVDGDDSDDSFIDYNSASDDYTDDDDDSDYSDSSSKKKKKSSKRVAIKSNSNNINNNNNKKLVQKKQPEKEVAVDKEIDEWQNVVKITSKASKRIKKVSDDEEDKDFKPESESSSDSDSGDGTEDENEDSDDNDHEKDIKKTKKDDDDNVDEDEEEENNEWKQFVNSRLRLLPNAFQRKNYFIDDSITQTKRYLARLIVAGNGVLSSDKKHADFIISIADPNSSKHKPLSANCKVVAPQSIIDKFKIAANSKQQ